MNDAIDEDSVFLQAQTIFALVKTGRPHERRRMWDQHVEPHLSSYSEDLRARLRENYARHYQRITGALVA